MITTLGNSRRPTIFIGSSTKGLEIAEALQSILYDTFETQLWNQGIFGLAEITVDALVKAGNYFDFAVLIFTADEETVFDGQTWSTPVGNVLVEYGFFLGRLGRGRTFILYEKNAKLRLPSDLNGITYAHFLPSPAKNYTAALGPARTKIKEAVEVELARQKGEESIKQERIRMLITDGLELSCRAVACNKTPEEAKLRAFLFLKNGAELVCSHFWAPYPVREVVGKVRFGINEETKKQVVIVRAAMKKEVCGAPITFLPEQLDDTEGEIEKDLRFVLAAPILAPNQEVLGTVDFDASSEIGEEILKNPVAHNVLFELGELLHKILS